jgi:uncharacterized protein (UPF0548 family)
MLAAVARWPLGVGLTSWRYMWRTTAMHRRELPGSPDGDGPPELPGEVVGDDVQRPGDGVGMLYHRCYRTRIRDAQLSAEEAMARLQQDPNQVAPTEFARFTKVRGDEGGMQAGDEYVVRMPGPWDGPVRVVDVTPRSFRLATLDGHLEAGQIEFSTHDQDGELGVRIESWARSGDRLSSVLYDRVRMAKEVQLHMWCSVLEQIVALSGGRMDGGIDIETRRVPPVDQRSRLEEMQSRPLNFDPAELGKGPGWVVDDYRQSLPAGSWDVAKRILRDYAFANPSLIRATYDPDTPLEGRTILLEARFLVLRFHLGVRIGEVVDESRVVDGRDVNVWGWNYRTLEGHFEAGQLDYELWRFQDTGAVEFRMHRVVRPARIPNPIVRLGFFLFGRGEQVRFTHLACRRMVRLTEAALSES